MEMKSRVTWLSVAVFGCLSVIAGLGYYTWDLHRQVTQLQAGTQTDLSASVARNQPQAQAPKLLPKPQNPFSGNFDPSGRFAEMQMRMDQMMKQIMPDDPLLNQNVFSMSSTDSPEVTMDESSDKYTVTVKLPKGENMDLNTELSDNTLTISGQVKTTSKDSSGNFIGQAQSASEFSQSITLADPVTESGMKVDHHGQDIVITIPKQVG